MASDGPQAARPRQLRVAYVVHTLQAGGLERCVAHFCNELDPAQFQPTVICLDRSGEAASWISRTDVEIVELHKRPGNDWGVVKRLAASIRERDISLVQSHNWGTLVESTLACRRTGTAHIHALHGQEWAPDRPARVKYLVQRMVRRWAYRRVDQLVSVAESVTNYFERHWGVPAERILYLPNGVRAPQAARDPSFRQQMLSQLGIDEQSVILGSTGRLAAVKDFASAVTATRDLIGRGWPVHLILVGEGPEKARLEQLAADLEIRDRVHLVGHSDRVGDWLALFDVFVNSSASEAMSMSILEAMSLGLPVVASDVGDTHKLIGGEDPCGMLVAAGQPTRLADAVDSMLSNADIRDEFSRRSASRYHERFSIEAMIVRYQSLYLDLVARIATRPVAEEEQ